MSQRRDLLEQEAYPEGVKGNLDWLYWCPLSRSLEVYLSNRVGSILNNLASGTAGRKALDIT
jgi:hypothetical protein